MNIINFDTLDSTNTYVKLHIDDLADKTIISTNVQTNGHGRFFRKWVDLGRENIYMTFVLKPSDSLLPVYANLTQYLSVCLCKRLEELGLKPLIKWPNDVLLNEKKVCGILAESVIKNGKLKGIALGIGINLNAAIDNLDKIDRPATSLNLVLGYNIDKKIFMEQLIKTFIDDYDQFLQKGFVMIKHDYEKRTCFLKQNIKVAVFNIVKEGIAKEIDDCGNLILLKNDGITEKINMGEII